MTSFLFCFLFFSSIAYNLSIYYLTDPSPNSFWKMSSVYSILTLGYISLLKARVPNANYVFIIFTYLAIYFVVNNFLKILQISL
ncbi:MAG: hypothetical protein CK427_03820 [Leptospira sp.]|nr:MAG: hypothetical protein CK427_03820 [Leptospira sp.]